MLSHSRMLSLLVFAVLCTSCLANPAIVHYSFSRAVGGGSGNSFSVEGNGRITGVRVWEINNSHITGIQLRYGFIWSAVAGRVFGVAQELILFDNEVITQVSGKFHSNYIYQVMFGTSRGRFLLVGQPTRQSFNFFPVHPDAELRLLSGRKNHVGITALAAHWGAVYMQDGNRTDVSS